MRPTLPLLAACLVALTATAADPAPATPPPPAPLAGLSEEVPREPYSYQRLAREATKDISFQAAPTTGARLLAWRSAIKYLPAHDCKPPQTGVSPRYVLTLYGGTIDLRRFLYVAGETLNRVAASGGKLPVAQAGAAVVLEDYTNDGGLKVPPEVLVKLGDPKYQPPPELPNTGIPGDYFSDALGVLFAEQLLAADKAIAEAARVAKAPRRDAPPADPAAAATPPAPAPADTTVEFGRELDKLLKPLVPLPDKLAQQFSYAAAVMGLTDDATPAQFNQRLNWYTVIPLVQTARFNAKARELGLPPLGEDVPDGMAALRHLGWHVALVRETYPILLETQPPKPAKAATPGTPAPAAP